MHQLYYIFILFAILFLFEKKAINILIAYIGILITASIMLPSFPYVQSLHSFYFWNISPTRRVGGAGQENILEGPILATLNSIGGEYYSYIIILVQVSALTILFGFIIMLFPSLSRLIPINPVKNIYTTFISSLQFSKEKIFFLPQGISLTQRVSGTGKRYKILRTIIITIIITIIYIYIFNINILQILNLYLDFKSKYNSFFLSSLLYSPTLCNIISIDALNDIPLNNIKDLFYQEEGIFLRKLGGALYNNDSTILKLFILTIILLLAIISLFFLIS